MRYAATATLGLILVLLGTVLPAQADSAKKTAPSKRPIGNWERTEGQIKIRFEVKADTLRAMLMNEDDSVQADADYSITKDGHLYGRVSQIEKKGQVDAPPEGVLFSFRFEVKGTSLIVSDFQGPGGAVARQLLEGEYKRTPAKSGTK